MKLTAPLRLLLSAMFLAAPALVQAGETAAPAAAPAPAKDTATLPTARAVLERNITATGGRAAFEAAQAVHFTGHFSMPLQGMTGDVDAWQVQPGKSLVSIDIPGVGKIQSGSDGTIGWSTDPMQGARLMTDKEMAQAKLTEGLLQNADFDEVFTTMEMVGREDFEGTAAWKLRLVTKEGGIEQDAWYDVETALQRGLRMEVESPMGKLPATIIMADYKEFSGLVLPTRIVQRMTAMGMGIEQIMTIDAVTVNPETLPSFEPPAEVKALQARAAAGE